jgi:integrase
LFCHFRHCVFALTWAEFPVLNLYKRGRIFWARGTVNRVRVQKSLDTQFKEEARLRIVELERRLHSGVSVRLPWPEFQAEFLSSVRPSIKPRTLQKYQFVLSRFARHLAANHVDSLQAVTPATISRYLADRAQDIHPTRKTRIGSEGQKADLRVLHAAFAYAVKCKYMESNPVTQSRAPSTQRVTMPFTEDEIARMLAACDSRPRRGDPYPLKPIILTFLHTGLRISDVIGLEKREVDLDAGRIVKRTEKRGKTVSIPIHPELAAALRKHLELPIDPILPHFTPSKSPPKSPLLFHTATGKPLNSLDAYLARLWRRAGIQGAHPHRLRDSFAVRLLRQGASLYDTAMLMGISVRTCEMYYSPYVVELQKRGRELIESVAPSGAISVQPATRISPSD